MYKILVVDDEPGIRTMLQDFLESDYDVKACSNAQEALAETEINTYDLVISDINMPGMKGYVLLDKIKSKSPKTKTVLITAYNVDDYIRLAKKHGICNIISKTAPFNFDELEYLVHGLTTGDIFGIEKHLNKNYTSLGNFTIQCSSDAKKYREKVLQLIPDLPRDSNEIKLVLDEIITNALYHAPLLKTGETKYEEYKSITLDENEYIHISVAKDDDKVCLSIIDNQGNLDKDRIIYLLDRHVNSEGIFDESGRGIYMSRLFSDRIIINIDPQKRSEFIIMFYLKQDTYKGFKPLYINQL
jgi:CheY-like chemotaxis protein